MRKIKNHGEKGKKSVADVLIEMTIKDIRKEAKERCTELGEIEGKMIFIMLRLGNLMAIKGRHCKKVALLRKRLEYIPNELDRIKKDTEFLRSELIKILYGD